MLFSQAAFKKATHHPARLSCLAQQEPKGSAQQWRFQLVMTKEANMKQKCEHNAGGQRLDPEVAVLVLHCTNVTKVIKTHARQGCLQTHGKHIINKNALNDAHKQNMDNAIKAIISL